MSTKKAKSTESMNQENITYLARFFKAVAHRYKINVLLKINSKSLNKLAEELDVPVSTLQRHVSELIKLRLIAKGENNQYHRTEHGNRVLEAIDQINYMALYMKQIEIEDVKKSVLHSSLSLNELKDLIREMEDKEQGK